MNITCFECGLTFESEKKITNPYSRCPTCRKIVRARVVRKYQLSDKGQVAFADAALIVTGKQIGRAHV